MSSQTWHGYHLPSITDPYVYLQSLMSTSTVMPMGEPFVGGLAKGVLKYGIKTVNNSSSIDKSLQFIKDAANKMRAHEFSFINNQIQKLEKLGTIGESERELINQFYAMQNGTLDYKVFITSLNGLLTNIERYKSRVTAFLDKKIVNLPQVNTITSLPTLIHNYTNRRSEIYYSQEEVIRQATAEYFKRYASDFLAQINASDLDSILNFVAAQALVSQQLAQYIYDNKLMSYRRISGKEKKGKFEDFASIEDFEKQVKQIYKYLDDFNKTHNVSSLFGNQRLFDDLKREYGIEYDASLITKYTKSAQNEIAEINTLLKHDDLITDPTVKDILNHIKTKWHSTSSHPLSAISELVSSLLMGKSHGSMHIGKLNLGTDFLLGYFSIDTDIPSIKNNPIQVAMNNIATRISRESGRTDMKHLSEIYEEELNALANTLDGIGKAFILHETTKNYNSLEQGRWPGNLKMHAFEGRSMSIFNYIDAISTFGEQSGISTNWLKFIAYNFATDALGSMNIDPLSNIFATFGGMIMFDDFAIIGHEITDALPNSIENIHLYKLQDMYFPASMFLDATYNAFKGLENELLNGNGFQAVIEAPTINYSYEYGEKFEERWQNVKYTAETNTKITLYFAAQFLNMMQYLL